MNIASILLEQARARGANPAIVDGSRAASIRTLTFGELASAAADAAARLRKAGLRPGDAVLVFVPMSLELYVVLTALFREALVAMFVDPSAGLDHIKSCCSFNSPKAFIGTPRAHCLRLVSSPLRSFAIKFSTSRPFFGAPALLRGSPAGGPNGVVDCAPETPALIRFTSGSTGQPKPSVRTHGFVREQHRVLEKSLGLVPGEMDLATLPMFVLANLASGVTSIIPRADLRAPGAIKPGPVIQQILTLKPQRVSASPAFVERLADYCVQTSQPLDCLQAVYTGGAPVFPRSMDRFQEAAPAAEIVAVYGSTEAEPMAQLSRREMLETDRQAMANGAGLLVGKPEPALRLRILGEGHRHDSAELRPAEFDAACRAVGEPGEIVVSGPHVQPSVTPCAAESATGWRVNGSIWHRTGDAGYLDVQGRLWLLGRCGARVRDSLGTLYPLQVECAATGEPAIKKAALLAKDGKRILCVEASKGTDLSGLQQKLAWSRIHRVQPMRRIPVDTRHNAKIDYVALHKLV